MMHINSLLKIPAQSSFRHRQSSDKANKSFDQWDLRITIKQKTHTIYTSQNS